MSLEQGLGVPNWIWQLILVIAALVVGSVVFIWAWGRLRGYIHRLSVPPSGPGWTLEQVKRLHESGQLTDKQYKRLREQVAKGLLEKENEGRVRR